MKKQFGAKASQVDISRYALSKQWDGERFLNLEETKMEFSFQSLPKLLYKQFCEKAGREPENRIPIVPFDSSAFLKASSEVKMIWYGHSVVLMRINNKTLLIDPMLGSNAAPISPFPVKRFSDNTLNLIDDFPEIDLLLLTHDHYDHLDYESIQKLKPKVKQYFVALGVARHLVQWGVNEADITEFDWWEHKVFEGIDVTFTPTRHFSGRGLRDRAKSLWGGWVFNTPNENIWFSGDGGYGKHFKEIGNKFGNFDFSFMECGQYNANWHQIHMYPEESIQAANDTNSRTVMPVHWAGFSLAQHTWREPADRFVAEARRVGLNFVAPSIGIIFGINDKFEESVWWR